MKKVLYLLTLILGLGITNTYSQEIWANGIDDDLDGFIDCFDKNARVRSFVPAATSAVIYCAKPSQLNFQNFPSHPSQLLQMVRPITLAV